jgi:hypothetical protein
MQFLFLAGIYKIYPAKLKNAQTRKANIRKIANPLLPILKSQYIRQQKAAKSKKANMD